VLPSNPELQSLLPREQGTGRNGLLERSSMQSTQSAFAIAFCVAGAIVLVVAHYQTKHKQVGKVPLISARAKHVIGLLGIIIGVLIFAAELMLRR
jgi:hypothetical protein